MSDTERFDYEIAVTGMAGRFPGAKNLAEFWRNLCAGVETVSFFSDEELRRKGVDPALLADARYVKAEAVLDDVEMFDAAFFGFTPREAEIMDPQHRLFLETCWEALEISGYDSERYAGRIGIFAGESLNSYLLHNLYGNRELLESVGSSQAMIGNDRDYLATNVAYKLNLKGPGISVQTACSTSLVAVHLACQSLLNRECDMALSGGVSVSVPQGAGAMSLEGGIISPDGHCRAFDARARGTVKGSGVGVVVLKRLGDALADGDTVYAVVKGSAVNNDGAGKIGFTAPGVEGQSSVIEEALAMASVEPSSVSYVEAHGTGTPLGDPIEVAALARAFRATTEAKNFCALGSVKTNIGHLDAAAGIAGLIKTVLALRHKQRPPSLHFEQPNPNIDFAASPFYVNTRLAAWEPATTPRRAGVSSFGIGGTNAHVVLEEAPLVDTPTASRRPFQLLTLSAKTPTAIEQIMTNLAAHLRQNSDLDVADVAYTLQLGRREFNHRRAVVCADVAGAVRALEAGDAKSVSAGLREEAARPVVFMFSGQGAQHVDAARGLYESEPIYRQQIDRCAELLKSDLGCDLRDVLYPATDAGDEASAADAAARLMQTRLAQPALFAVEYALAQLWMSWGVRPAAMIGHSLGEYAAACVAGVFSLEDALRVVAARGRLMSEMPPGAMLAVPLAAAEVEPLLDANLSLAAINAPSMCVVSGGVEAVEAFAEQLRGRGLACRKLNTSHALHSAATESVMAPFTDYLRQIELRAPQIPYVSGLTGRWISGTETTDPDYWAKHLRQPVRFADGIREILQEPRSHVLLEVGPGQTLAMLVKQHGEAVAGRVVVSTTPHPQQRANDAAHLLDTLGKLWVAGVEIDWTAFHGTSRRRRVALPTYPFERRRYWIEPPPAMSVATPEKLSRRAEMGEWFYVPSWKRALTPERVAPESNGDKTCWLVFEDECGVGARLTQRLGEQGEDVFRIEAGTRFEKIAERSYRINPAARGDYDSLITGLRAQGKTPRRIMHLWQVTPEPAPLIRAVGAASPNGIEESLSKGFYSLIFLAQALGDYAADAPVRVGVLTNNGQSVTGEELLSPEKATAFGACRVIPQEYQNIDCVCIDIELSPAPSAHHSRLLENLLAEMVAGEPSATVAYRGRHRWVQIFEPLPLSVSQSDHARASRLREGGVYLFTGGVSEVDLALAGVFVERASAKIVFTGSHGLPEKGEWRRWLAGHDEAETASRRMRSVLNLEEAGAEILVLDAAITDEQRMRAVVAEVVARFGGIDGVVHSSATLGGGLVQLKTRESAAAVLAPKVAGTVALSAALGAMPLDFFVLFSNALSITGALGQVDFCAANAFLDAFAQSRATGGQTFTVAIDWRLPHWENRSQPHGAGASAVQSEFDRVRELYGITLPECLGAFERVLSNSQPQVIVSTQDFQALIDEQQRASARAGLLSEHEAMRFSESSAQIKAGDDAPHDEIERTVAGIWRELFGIESIGVHDDFFDLGGNSLLAIQLVAQLRKAFQLELPLGNLFESPTVAELAPRINEIMLKEREAQEIARLLAEIEMLSPEELQASLAHELQTGSETNGDG